MRHAYALREEASPLSKWGSHTTMQKQSLRTYAAGPMESASELVGDVFYIMGGVSYYYGDGHSEALPCKSM
jgi:hypothetical protein